MGADVVAEWRRLESRYRARSYRGVGAPDECSLRRGRNGVLLTAGHSVAHARDGERKGPDLRTGGLAELVAARAGASALTVVGAGPGDPNRDADHPFKRALAELASTHPVVLDLHGMRDQGDVDIWVGAGNAARSGWLAATCLDSAAAHGLRVAAGAPFGAARATTLTSTAIELGCEAAQIEIAARSRDLDGDPAACERVAAWLIALVGSLGS